MYRTIPIAKITQISIIAMNKISIFKPNTPMDDAFKNFRFSEELFGPRLVGSPSPIRFSTSLGKVLLLRNTLGRVLQPPHGFQAQSPWLRRLVPSPEC
ncbi:MAG: hypothetical protein NZ873_01675 [Crenarchaeota archaeon]|nr:hypothetical protein [Thermoproteota archaeon]MDW8034105.1 hypothetical protein [Nitrososphaerota archaeon]